MDRKPRKSVAFSEDTTVVDGDGQVTEMNGNGSLNGGDKTSAESHAKAEDKEADDVDALMGELSLKKKKKAKPKDKDAEKKEDKAEADGDDLDISAIKKKKKSKKPKADDFDAKLAEAGGADGEDKQEAVPAAADEDQDQSQEGDLDKGTGIWAHENKTPIGYNALLTRFFSQLHSFHPDLASGVSKSYKIPPPQCLREGNKKTIFANLAEICKRMKRTDEHVSAALVCIAVDRLTCVYR
jgi:translation initiation factor 2 subunit 2